MSDNIFLEDILEILGRYGWVDLKRQDWANRNPDQPVTWKCEVRVKGYNGRHLQSGAAAEGSTPREAAYKAMVAMEEWWDSQERGVARARYLASYENALRQHLKHPHGITGHSHPGEPYPELDL